MYFRYFLPCLVFLYSSDSAVLVDDNELTVECGSVGNAKKLQIKGKIISTSKIDINKCGEETKLIEIFADEKAIIDQDLVLLGREVQVIIIAPIWEIIYDRVINLNGANAKDFNDPARDGSETGNLHGVDGLAGLPGGPAGSFYGVANEIFNAQRLSILANGGKGGKGQNGGNGANGRVGKTFKNVEEFDCKKGEAEGFISEVNGKTGKLCVKVDVEYTVFGQFGESGGRGGNGGIGGLGGHAGSIVLFDFSKSNGKSYAKTSIETGHPGLDGLGSPSGLEGNDGDTIIVTCSPVNLKCKPKAAISTKSIVGKSYRRHQSTSGSDGKSLKKRQMPKIASIIQNFPQTVNLYKFYVRPKVASDNNKKSLLYSFYDSLNSHDELTKLYKTINLVDEFKDLELQYFNTKDRDFLSSTYISLSKRFTDHFNKLNLDKRTDKLHTEVMRDLLWLMQRRTKVINGPKGYSVMTNITNGFTSNGVTAMEELVKHEKVNYKIESFYNRITRVDYLIKEGQNLINKDLVNAMKDLQITLDLKIGILLNEITKIIEDTDKVESDLITKRKELRQAVYLKSVLGLMKMSCGMAAVVNPSIEIVASVGSSISSVTSLGLSLFQSTDISSEVDKVAKVKSIISKAAEKFAVDIDPNKQEENMNNLISEMTKDLSKSGKSMFNEMKDSLMKKLKDNKISWEKSYIEDITKALEKATKEKDATKKKDCETLLNVVKYLKVGNEVISGISTTLKTVVEDVQKINEINTALSSNKENFDKLHTIEKGIYNQIQPMLEKMFTDINEASFTTDSMNANQIVIAKWNVCSVIKDVQQKLKTTFETFEAFEEMQWTLEKLTTTFKNIIEMYENILKNNNDKSETSFTASMHLPIESKILAQDYQLARSLAKLNKVFYQNELKDKYTEWIYAFKQFSFPNGGEFLFETRWSDPEGNDVEQIMGDIKKNIKSFEEHFDMEKKKDNFLINQIIETYRGSYSTDGKAFFVLSDKSSNGIISNILQGNIATISTKELTKKIDSLKFNNVGIIFTSKDTFIQQKLFSVLSKFRVYLTHNGDSIYTLMDKTFVIETNPVELIFNYPEKKNEIAGISSPMHKKFATGDYILSPYATWTVKLESRGAKEDFDLLKVFIGKVDLELIGEAQHFISNRCNKVCQDIMMKTYRLSTKN